MDIEQINLFLTSKEFSNFLFPFKIVALIVSLIMIYLINYYLFKQKEYFGEAKRKFKNFFSSQGFTAQSDLFNQWMEIKTLLSKEDQITYKLIVNKSASLFYNVLENSNLKDKELGELSEKQIPNLSEIKELLKLDVIIREDPIININIQRVK
jgi:hypothetical protein